MATIFLTGIRGAGKTATGSLLAELLNCPFMDLDDIIVTREKAPIAAIVEREGWPGFRAKESEALRETIKEAAALPLAVVALGGGAILDPANRKLVRESGWVCRLKASAACVGARLARNPDAAKRPSLTGKDLVAELSAVMAERESAYAECAHCEIDAEEGARAVAEKALAEFLKTRTSEAS